VYAANTDTSARSSLALRLEGRATIAADIMAGTLLALAVRAARRQPRTWKSIVIDPVSR
jgi:hypothetical protein